MKMNEVDYLLSDRFSLMSLEEKLEVKRLGTHQPNDVQNKVRSAVRIWPVIVHL